MGAHCPLCGDSYRLNWAFFAILALQFFFAYLLGAVMWS